MAADTGTGTRTALLLATIDTALLRTGKEVHCQSKLMPKLWSLLVKNFEGNQSASECRTLGATVVGLVITCATATVQADYAWDNKPVR
jgi:hypothetical protein